MNAQDVLAIGLLVFLEGVLSIDNALVLAIMVKPLHPSLQKKALTYGMVGAFGFRIFALSFVSYLMRWTWMKFAGGGYLCYIALAHFFEDNQEAVETKSLSPTAAFWKTILAVELTDIAFSVDSILAAMAVSTKLWVICVGGILGITMMRFAAVIFVRLLEKYPALDRTAYGLVLIIGSKLLIEGLLPCIDFHSGSSPAFWVFWGALALTLATGFLRQSNSPTRT
jgi:YkoY family integral membrane protein